MSAMDNATRNAGDMIKKQTMHLQPVASGDDHQGTHRNHLGRRSALTRAVERTRTETWPPISPAGRITQVIGAVVDVQFDGESARNSERAGDDEPGQAPRARSRAASRRKLRSHHRHGHRPKVWCAARKSPTPARRSPFRSATKRSGRIINVIGEPVDEAGPMQHDVAARHPSAGAFLRRAGDGSADSRDRHQGRRSARALRQGRQDRPVRRRRRRQDRADHGAHQQHRQGAWRLFRLRRRRRAHPRGQRPLSRDDRGRRQQEGRRRRLEMRAGLRPDERAAGRAHARRAVRPDRRRRFPRPRQGRAVLRRQHLPLHAGGLGSVGAARPHSFGGGLSADARHRHGRAAGAHHHDDQGLDHLGAGDLRSGRRLDRPGAGHLLRPFGRDDRAVALDRGKGHLSGGRSARLDLAHAVAGHRRRRALRRRA